MVERGEFHFETRYTVSRATNDLVQLIKYHFSRSCTTLPAAPDFFFFQWTKRNTKRSPINVYVCKDVSGILTSPSLSLSLSLSSDRARVHVDRSDVHTHTHTHTHTHARTHACTNAHTHTVASKRKQQRCRKEGEDNE